MHDLEARSLHRLSRLVSERLHPAIRCASSPLSVESWEAPGEPVSFAEASDNTFEPFQVPGEWGRPWGTTWFRLKGDVPTDCQLD